MSGTFEYDRVDYPSTVHAQIHPSRIAAIARLHGLPCASPAQCRLLEVGCGDGLQLLSLAQAYPHSQFVGIDLSTRAIARGEAWRQALGLHNLQLVAADLTTWEPQGEPFDFIVAHGFYSWVPAPVRDCLMRLCATRLAPAGLACISYNTLPGGHLRRMLWDIMRYHSEGAATPQERIERALECLDLLELGMPADRQYGIAMREEIASLRQRLEPSVLFHDDLAQINDPCSFDDFLKHANAHGLAFMAEASYHEMSLLNAHPDARDMLAGIAEDDLATKEQYLDFFTGRRFRQSLLVRAGTPVRVQPDARAIAGFDLVSKLVRRQGDDTQDGMRFDHPDNGGLSTDDPLMQQLLLACADPFPHPERLAQALQAARARIGAGLGADTDDGKIHRLLLQGFQVGVLELHLDAPRFALQATGRPVANPLARLMIADGHARVPSLRPHMVELSAQWMCEFLYLLDGSRDLARLRQMFDAAVESGALEVRMAAGADAFEEALARMSALAILLQDPPDA